MRGSTPSSPRAGDSAKAEQASQTLLQADPWEWRALWLSGLAALQTVKDKGKLGIGVDSNQNHLHPGSVLTSMVKRVDVAVYDAFMTAKNDTFKPGINVLGLKESGVDVAMDDNNAPLITAEMKAAIDKARADIDSGAVKVHDYMTDETCPY